MIPALARDELRTVFRRMLLIRRFEEACIIEWHKGNVPGHYHVSVGQEATAAGVSAALDADDLMYSTHRNHGHVLSRGADPGKALAEILGKATGYGKGKAGTLHGSAAELGVPLSTAIVGGVLPISVGSGYAMQMRKKPNVSVAMFGDGAMEEGAAYEALNLASLWKFPVLFMCENNGWGVSREPGQSRYHAPNLVMNELVDLAEILRIDVITVDGVDLGDVYKATTEARERAIAGGGPTFIEVRTKVWPGGQWPELVTGITDIGRAWIGQAPAEFAHMAGWFRHDDPVLQTARELAEVGIFSRQEIEMLDAEVRTQMDDAVRFALDSPFPPVEDALMDVWPA
jgi:TPP-dependent pyruvate/acetoin dehydrogenase alpha subunit